MSKQAFKRVRRALGMEVSRKPLDSYAWPGGYPLYYPLADGGGCLCPECANKNIGLINAEMREAREFVADPKNAKRGYRRDAGQWEIGAPEAHWEGSPIICENCNAQIESAYGAPEEEREGAAVGARGYRRLGL